MKLDNLSLTAGRSAKAIRTETVSAILFGVVLAVLPMSVSADAVTYYVSPTGNDTSGDGSDTIPWRTISHAISEAAPGDIIKVMDDDDEATDDYVENVTVNKSLTIERYDDIDANPQIKARDTNMTVFSVTADGVIMRGLDVYGAMNDYEPAIYLARVSNCTIRDIRCGWDWEHMNSYAISLSYSNDNTVADNTCSNNTFGIQLHSSANNAVSGNTCNWNDIAMFLFSSSHNTVSGNTCDSGKLSGISLYSSSSNMISGNICSPDNAIGMLLREANGNVISGNICSKNGRYGFILDSSNDNIIYLNDFSRSDVLVASEESINTWCSPTEFGYFYGTSTQVNESHMGNYYDDSGSDSDNDGIGDSPYSTDGDGDKYRLVQPRDNYDLQVWYLANPRMCRGDMSKQGAIISIDGGASQIWVADRYSETDMSFGTSTQEGSRAWRGSVTFTSAVDGEDAFTVEVGYADDQNGTNFWEDGPEAAIIGETSDDSTTAFVYTTNAVPFTLTQGKYLALRITNGSSSRYSVRVGGSWSYVVAPQGSEQVPTGMDEERHSTDAPSSFLLSPNYPNPFNTETTIRFALPDAYLVDLRIYDLAGQRVATLLNSWMPHGTHSVVWDGTDDKGRPVASGVYSCRLKAGRFQRTKKIVLIK